MHRCPYPLLSWLCGCRSISPYNSYHKYTFFPTITTHICLPPSCRLLCILKMLSSLKHGSCWARLSVFYPKRGSQNQFITTSHQYTTLLSSQHPVGFSHPRSVRWNGGRPSSRGETFLFPVYILASISRRLGVFCVQGEVFRPEVGTHLYWPYKAGPSSRSETRASVGQVCFSCKV